ncbi:MAG: response regulator [Methylocystaceae bacterium]
MAEGRILVADDQKGVRRLLEELFRKEGYEVCMACDGLEAVQKAVDFAPEVILMDMKMPNMNGLEACAEIFKRNPEVPVIMMTAYGEMEVVKKALEIGVRKYITKPFDIIDLRNMVREVLDQSQDQLNAQ